jgi:hypothetical protein
MFRRTIPDQLREEYFDLLPEIGRVAGYLEAEIRYHTREILQRLQPYEQLVFKSRVKGCESALQSLRRRQEGGTFDAGRPDAYSLLDLPDLAGVRVLVFPRSRLTDVDLVLREVFEGWSYDPVPDGAGGVLAPKYSGRRTQVSRKVRAEYQIVPMLIGLYWEVEHSAIYKPAPAGKGLKNKAASEPMEDLNASVVRALLNFEAEFERRKLDPFERTCDS